MRPLTLLVVLVAVLAPVAGAAKAPQPTRVEMAGILFSSQFNAWAVKHKHPVAVVETSCTAYTPGVAACTTVLQNTATSTEECVGVFVASEGKKKGAVIGNPVELAAKRCGITKASPLPKA